MEIEMIQEIVMVDIGDIIPYPNNPRKNEVTSEKLSKVIPKVGWNVPIVLDKNNVIVKGHARYKAALLMGLTMLPCVYTNKDEATVRLDRLSDNRVADFTKWNASLLLAEVGDIKTDFDMSILELGFDVQEMEKPELQEEVSDVSEGEYGYGVDSDDHISEEGMGGEVTDAQPEYIEVVCSDCGEHMFVRKR